MARSKKFDRRIHVRLDDMTLTLIESLSRPREDRSDYIRAAVELETAIRQTVSYDELNQALTGSETLQKFYAQAIRRHIARRERLIAGESDPAV